MKLMNVATPRHNTGVVKMAEQRVMAVLVCFVNYIQACKLLYFVI